MGIHKYGPDTSSSQLGIKSLRIGVPRADGHGFRSCIVVCCVLCVACFVLNMLCDMCGDLCE